MSDYMVLLFAAMMSAITFYAGVRIGFKEGYRQGFVRGTITAVVKQAFGELLQ